MKIEIEIDVAMLANDVKAGISYDDIKKRAIDAVVAGSVARIVDKLEPVTKKLEESVYKELEKKEKSEELRKLLVDHATTRLSFRNSDAIERKVADIVDDVLANNKKCFETAVSKNAKEFIVAEIKRQVSSSRFMGDIEDKLGEHVWDCISSNLETFVFNVDISSSKNGKIVDRKKIDASIYEETGRK